MVDCVYKNRLIGFAYDFTLDKSEALSIFHTARWAASSVGRATDS